MEIPLEKKIELLLLTHSGGMSWQKAAQQQHIALSSAWKLLQNAEKTRQRFIEYATVLDGGRPYLLWPELLTMNTDNTETPRDLRKRIRYLEAKVAYYEELAKLEGMSFAKSVKKNDCTPSETHPTEETGA